jgi:hypothetical protein
LWRSVVVDIVVRSESRCCGLSGAGVGVAAAVVVAVCAVDWFGVASVAVAALPKACGCFALPYPLGLMPEVCGCYASLHSWVLGFRRRRATKVVGSKATPYTTLVPCSAVVGVAGVLGSKAGTRSCGCPALATTSVPCSPRFAGVGAG